MTHKRAATKCIPPWSARFTEFVVINFSRALIALLTQSIWLVLKLGVIKRNQVSKFLGPVVPNIGLYKNWLARKRWKLE